MAKHLFLVIAVLFVVAIIVVAKNEKPAVEMPAGTTPVAVEVDESELELVRGQLFLAFKAQPDTITQAPLDGFYEVVYGSEIFYISADARHLMSGEIFDLATLENLTEQRRAGGRQKIMAAIPESSMIIYRAQEEKHVLTVFTDIDCVYCRKLHQEMAQINDLGISVRYLAYPRAGFDSPSYDKAVSVWCAEDRNGAMDRAKANEPVAPQKCDAPISMHMHVAEQLGINSTPSLLLDNGRLQPGYAPAERLLSLFE